MKRDPESEAIVDNHRFLLMLELQRLTHREMSDNSDEFSLVLFQLIRESNTLVHQPLFKELQYIRVSKNAQCLNVSASSHY